MGNAVHKEVNTRDGESPSQIQSQIWRWEEYTKNAKTLIEMGKAVHNSRDGKNLHKYTIRNGDGKTNSQQQRWEKTFTNTQSEIETEKVQKFNDINRDGKSNSQKTHLQRQKKQFINSPSLIEMGKLVQRLEVGNTD